MTAPALAFPARPGPSSPVSLGVLGAADTRLLAGPPHRRETLAEHCARLGVLSLPYTDAARAHVMSSIAASGLVGRGGGEFPLVGKLTAALRATGVPIIVVNGSESEPASRKDALLLRSRPHLVLDGASLAAATVGAHQIVVYLHKESGATYTSVMEAVRERNRLLGVPGIVVTTAASGFVAGESSAIVSVLSGGAPVPRRRSVPAAVSGIHGRPTVVSNVETLAHLGLIGRFGADWFKGAGSSGTPGSTLLTLGGDVTSPGLVVEVSAPVSIGTVLVEHGGLVDSPQAVLIGGYGGRWISGAAAWNAPVDRAVLRRAGVSLGCGLIAPLPADSCGLEVTVRLLDYLAAQSAGQCGSCVFGLPRLAVDLRAIVEGRATRRDVRRSYELAQSVAGRGACAHPDGAVALLESALEVFSADLRNHVRGQPCGRGVVGWFPLSDASHTGESR
ncbi:MAG TPA: NADH-ubiquinone oxidoreductase-F iron-sulfur binding region domain-containing protein [Acidothermaceae bacterium]|nr:NADH-ubiquinone oxidoreductase-F iron-sulfur binding region domain-containing protein [Acidothermaceae bacterium]